MVNISEKPHIALRDGYWRVSLTPPQYWGWRGEGQKWVQANNFAGRLNHERQMTKAHAELQKRARNAY